MVPLLTAPLPGRFNSMAAIHDSGRSHEARPTSTRLAREPCKSLAVIATDPDLDRKAGQKDIRCILTYISNCGEQENRAAGGVMAEINATALKTYDIAIDGRHVRLHVKDASGEEASLVLPTESIAELMMTLPQMLRAALRRQHADPTLKLVHELENYSVESITGEKRFILTLRTPDGFEVSFAMSNADLANLAETVTDGADNSQVIPRLM
jgi:hypothetical protein